MVKISDQFIVGAATMTSAGILIGITDTPIYLTVIVLFIALTVIIFPVSIINLYIGSLYQISSTTIRGISMSRSMTIYKYVYVASPLFVASGCCLSSTSLIAFALFRLCACLP